MASSESITWKDPSGTSHPFDGSGNYLALIGEQGNYMTVTALLDQRTPLRPGTNIRYFDLQPRILTYPILVTATTEMNLRTAIRQLCQMFNTPAGSPGTLIATAPDGVSQRQITAYYYDGLEGDGSEGNREPGSILFPLQLEAADPFWYDTTAISTSYTDAQLLAGITVNNASDFLVWPVWQFNGPFTNMVITNTTTGQAIKTTAAGGLTVTTGNVLHINTLAGTIIVNISNNKISNLTTDSVLFGLVPGNNVITFTYTGDTPGTTSGNLTYTNRWLSC